MDRLKAVIIILALITVGGAGYTIYNHFGKACEQGIISSAPATISVGSDSNDSSSDVNNNDADVTVCPEKMYMSMDYIPQSIMNSEFAGYIGKTEAEIETKYGQIQSEGDWYNGLLYTKHKNFSGSIGYGAADPKSSIESIENDSICNTIAFKLSELMPVSNVNFNKDDLEFVYDDSEGDYYYIFKNIDVPIHIDCDENGNIEQDPWIFIYLEH